MSNSGTLNADFGAGRRQPPGSSLSVFSSPRSSSSERGGVSPLAVSNREAMSAILCGRQPAEMSAPDCQSREAAAAGSPIPPHFCRRFAAPDPRGGCFPWAYAHGYLLPSLCDSRLRLGSGRFEVIERDWTRRIARGLRPKSQGADATPLRKNKAAAPLRNLQQLSPVVTQVRHTGAAT